MILRDIHLNRAQKTLIADGELPLEPGKTTVLFGPSGSGKSTLLYALGELDSFVELSTDAGACPLHCEHVGLVPQQSAVFEDFGSAGENIAFAHDHTACRNHDDLEAGKTGATPLENYSHAQRGEARFPGASPASDCHIFEYVTSPVVLLWNCRSASRTCHCSERRVFPRSSPA